MSRIVGCAGTSHSPMLALPPVPGWVRRAEADESGVTEIIDGDGHRRDFAELRSAAGERYMAELHSDVWERKYQRCCDAIERLGTDIKALAPDLLVIIGDDQRELFSSKNNPSIAISYAPTVDAAGSEDGDNEARHLFRRRMGMNGNSYPGDSEAALHLIATLMERRFDVAAISGLDEGAGFGHAFTWVLGRMLDDAHVPAVPVLLNTYYPPNQPLPARCLQLGQALRDACESLPGDRRVVVVASGGLSHFIVDAELDQAVLTAIRTHDLEVLENLPPHVLSSGTSEIRNWITMSGAATGLTCRWMEYQPAFRTAAGTGCGLAFALLS